MTTKEQVEDKELVHIIWDCTGKGFTEEYSRIMEWHKALLKTAEERARGEMADSLKAWVKKWHDENDNVKGFYLVEELDKLTNHGGGKL